MLKSVDQVLKPDPLVASTCGRDGSAPLTVEEHHHAVAQITLSNAVPAVAGEAFDRARNAFLYAWFSYDLGALAEAQAIFSVELALRQRLGERAHPKDTISNLLEKAVKDGLVIDNPPDTPSIASMFRAMRNEWAHGSTHIHSPAMTLSLLEWCASLINEAFASD
ncbi:MAG: hypothetical protein IE921_01810 [Rhodobacteraceae bacterium]|nr:hypothetical protein [Paracoccaceae bacterium]